MASLEEVVARCVSGDLALGSEAATRALWDILCDPDEWETGELCAALAPLSARAVPRRDTGLVKLERGTVVVGDLEIDGDLECLAHTLVVGNLRCSGYVYSGIHDCVIVTGDVEARAIDALRSYWTVGGGITAETTWLSTYGFMKHGGALTTRLLVVEQAFELHDDGGAVAAATRIDADYLADDADARHRLAEVLDLEGLLDTDGELDRWELLRRVARGERVFR